MLADIDYVVRSMVVWPLVMIGLLLTYAAEAFIRAGAWLANVDPDNDEQYL